MDYRSHAGLNNGVGRNLRPKEENPPFGGGGACKAPITGVIGTPLAFGGIAICFGRGGGGAQIAPLIG